MPSRKRSPATAPADEASSLWDRYLDLRQRLTEAFQNSDADTVASIDAEYRTLVAELPSRQLGSLTDRNAEYERRCKEIEKLPDADKESAREQLWDKCFGYETIGYGLQSEEDETFYDLMECLMSSRRLPYDSSPFRDNLDRQRFFRWLDDGANVAPPLMADTPAGKRLRDLANLLCEHRRGTPPTCDRPDNITPAQRDIWDVVVGSGRRQLRRQIQDLLDERSLAQSESVLKQNLAVLSSRMGVLPYRADTNPKGYGLPNWE